jgi:hypothetical protein
MAKSGAAEYLNFKGRTKLQIAAMIALVLSASTYAPEGWARSMPVDAFQGCEDARKAPQQAAPQTKAGAANRDRINRRVMASLPVVDINSVPGALDGQCWFRVDGVWTDNQKITLDRSVIPRGWASDSPELLTLAIGTYTTPGYIMISPSKNSNTSLTVFDPQDPTRKTVFVSKDGRNLKDVLTQNGPVKTYQATQPSFHGRTLTIDVTRSGLARLKLERKSYFRPKPAKSAAQLQLDIDPNDPFYMNNALENLRAVRQGYDITTQDPFYLLSNDKLSIFAEPEGYYIDERRLVPLGMSFVQEATQGMVYRKTLITSASGTQDTVRETMGGKTGGERDAVYDVSVAVKYVTENTNSRMNSKTKAQAIGYSRNKQYALVVNHPFINLSDEFIDIISDANRAYKTSETTAWYYLDQLIAKFGTHYAQAVTFGASAKMTQTFDEKSYLEEFGSSTDFGGEAVSKIFGVGGSAHYSKLSGSKTSNSGTIGSEGATFVAVGGNGSWDQNGYSAGGTPYPILLDLRPIDELLSPLNFPDEELVYTQLRYTLKKRLEEYLKGRAKTFKDVFFSPQLNLVGTYFMPNDPDETWLFQRRSDDKIVVTKRVKGKRDVRAGVLTRVSAHSFSYNPQDRSEDRYEIKPNFVEFVSTKENYRVKLYPKGRWMYPKQGQLYDTYIGLDNPKDKLTFDMINANLVSVASSLRPGQKPDTLLRGGPDYYTSGTHRYWDKNDGSILVQDKKTKKYRYYVLSDRPTYANARMIEGVYEQIGNPKVTVAWEMTSPNTAKVKPSWIKNTEWWARSGPDMFGDRNLWRANPDGTISLINERRTRVTHFKKVAKKSVMEQPAKAPLGVVWGK